LGSCFNELFSSNQEMKNKVIVTGGAGYIGSHTIIELIQNTNFEVISVDNYINSSEETYARIEAVTGKKINYKNIDLCEKETLFKSFENEDGIIGIIHFAALKSVPESVENPSLYYKNNLDSLVNVIDFCNFKKIPNLIFSSSCSVYGNIETLPVSEKTPFNKAESPYAHTKQIGEQMLELYSKSGVCFKTLALRYFNPVGAHDSGLIGESPINPPTSLISILSQTALGLKEKMFVHGTDYPTRDGSCIRDYIHVSDIANAHVIALNKLINDDSCLFFDVVNLGTGNGVSVKEAIESFEKNNNVALNYEYGPRRVGDVISIFSDTKKSFDFLGWKAERLIDEMVSSAWKWQQNLSKEK
jgi:UDP-glucose 4-epimerase